MSATAGNVHGYRAATAEAWGKCQRCGEGSVDGAEVDQEPLWQRDEQLMCATCHEDSGRETDTGGERS